MKKIYQFALLPLRIMQRLLPSVTRLPLSSIKLIFWLFVICLASALLTVTGSLIAIYFAYTAVFQSGGVKEGKK